MNFLNNMEIYNVLTPTTGTTSLQGDVVDTAGFDGVCWIAQFSGNTNATGGYSQLYHMHGDSSASTSMVSCTSSVYIASPSATDEGAINDSLAVLDVIKPTKRYCALYAVKDSTNPLNIGAIGILYRNHKGAVTQPSSAAGVLFSATAVSPAT